MKNRQTPQILIGIILFVIGVATGVYGKIPEESTIPLDTSGSIGESSQERQAKSGYTYIDPLIECEIQSLGSVQKYIPFERQLLSKVQNDIMGAHTGVELSFYFRNMRNGPWFGINEQREYAPASLMKLPVAIAYLKWAESEPSVLTRILTGEQEIGTLQNIIPRKQITTGSGYTVDELIQYSLDYSDNNANRTLLNNITSENLFKVFRELGIPIIQELEAGESDYISVKEYAAFFRILYNASYLARDSSEHLLSIMAHAEFERGIKKPLPANIEVSHKFGERSYLDRTTGKTMNAFHDCGVVYYDKYPYLLCLMTKGEAPLEELEQIVEEISTVTYTTISNIYK